MVGKNSRRPSYSFKKFCLQTGIDGFLAFGRLSSKHKLYKIISFILILASVVSIFWLSGVNLREYLAYNVSTRVTKDTVSELVFPSITICNKNTFRRSVVGASEEFLMGISQFEMKNEKSLMAQFYQTKDTCRANVTNITALLQDPSKLWTDPKMSEVVRATMLNSGSGLLGCRWKNEIVGCNELFFDHLTDHGMCFSVRSVGKVNDVFETVLGRDFVNPLGLTPHMMKLDKSGESNGLKVILNAEQEEHCGVNAKWSGAGFVALIHDPNNFKSFTIDTPLSFQPGFSYGVVLKPTTVTRYTEHLKLCVSKFLLDNFGVKVTYVKVPCLTLCFLRKIWKQCNCIPVLVARNVQNITKLLGINTPRTTNQTLYCLTPSNLTCFSNWMNVIRQTSSFSTLCSECKEPCTETVYSFVITTTLLKHNQSTANEIGRKKNFLSINFYFEDMKWTNVVEKQAYMFTDVLTYFGNNIGLFMGMSCLSLCEIVYALIMTACYGRKRHRTIRYRPSKMEFKKRCNRVSSVTKVIVVKEAPQQSNVVTETDTIQPSSPAVQTPSVKQTTGDIPQVKQTINETPPVKQTASDTPPV